MTFYELFRAIACFDRVELTLARLQQQTGLGLQINILENQVRDPSPDLMARLDVTRITLFDRPSKDPGPPRLVYRPL